MNNMALEERLASLPFSNLYKEAQRNKIFEKVHEKIQRTLESIRRDEAGFRQRTLESIRRDEAGFRQRTLESIRRDVAGFRQLPFAGHLLTVLYLLYGDVDDAQQLSEELKQLWPADITGQLIRTYILLEKENVREAEESVTALEGLASQLQAGDFNVRFRYYSGLVDEAYLYYNLPPMYYYKAIELYQKAIAGMDSLCNNSQAEGTNIDLLYHMQSVVVIWKYHLLVTYNRMLNKGNESLGESDSSTHEGFIQICDTVVEMLNSGSFNDNVLYMARTFMELYDAHRKMKFQPPGKDCTCYLCETVIDYLTKTGLSDKLLSMTDTEGAKSEANEVQDFNTGGAENKASNIQGDYKGSIKSKRDKNQIKCDIFLDLALALCPTDGHILEKYGRLKRTSALTIDDLLEAERVLNDCVRIAPTRHVAWHQLGLTHQAKWLYPHKKPLYNNPFRSGEQLKPRGKKGKKKKNRDNDVFCFVASKLGQESDAKHKKGDIQHGEVRNNSSMLAEKSDGNKVDVNDEESEAHSATSVNEQLSLTGALSAEKKKIKVTEDAIPLKHDLKQDVQSKPLVHQTTSENERMKMKNNLPKHYSHADWFDKFRTANPKIAEGEEIPETLKDALRCFQKANDLVFKSQCRILTDLGRCYININQDHQSEKCFVKAKKCDSATEYDLAYLFEQWGLLMHEQMLNNDSAVDFSESKLMEKVKHLYRKSIQYCTQCQQKSRVAFNNLRDILKYQVHSNTNPDRELSISKELALLEKLVHRFKSAEDILGTILSRDGWKKDPELVGLAWELVDLFYRQGQYQTAWSYIQMNLLLVAELRNSKLIFDLGMILAEQLYREEKSPAGAKGPNNRKTDDKSDSVFMTSYSEVYAKIFSTVINLHKKVTRSVSMTGTESPKEEVIRKAYSVNSATSLAEKSGAELYRSDIIIVVETNNVHTVPVGYYQIKAILTDICGLHVLDDLDVLLPGGRVIPSPLQQYARHASAIVIFTDDIDSDKDGMRLLNSTAWSIVKEMIESKSTQPVVCLHYNERDLTELNKKYPTISTKSFIEAIQASDVSDVKERELKFIRQFFSEVLMRKLTN